MAGKKQEERLGMLNAIASGGKAGGDAYQQAINSAQNGKVEGLRLAADRAGAINAPEAFIARQNQIISQPLDSAAALATTQQGAANAYRGALNSAQGAYMNGVSQSQSLLSSLAQRAAEEADASAQAGAAKTYQSMIDNARTQRKQEEADAKDQAEAQLKMSQQELYLSPDLSTDERDTLRGLFDRNKSYGAALADLDAAGVDPQDPAFGTIYARLLQYYEPEKYDMMNPAGPQGDGTPVSTTPAASSTDGSVATPKPGKKKKDEKKRTGNRPGRN